MTTIVRRCEAVSLQGDEHVADHRPRQIRAQRLGDACAEALLGLREALDGQDRGGAHVLQTIVRRERRLGPSATA